MIFSLLLLLFPFLGVSMMKDHVEDMIVFSPETCTKQEIRRIPWLYDKPFTLNQVWRMAADALGSVVTEDTEWVYDHYYATDWCQDMDATACESEDAIHWKPEWNFHWNHTAYFDWTHTGYLEEDLFHLLQLFNECFARIFASKSCLSCFRASPEYIASLYECILFFYIAIHKRSPHYCFSTSITPCMGSMPTRLAKSTWQ